MIEIIVKVTAPACACGGTGNTLHTGERVLRIDHATTNESELAHALEFFQSSAEHELPHLLAGAHAELKAKAAAPPKPKKKGKQEDGSVQTEAT